MVERRSQNKNLTVNHCVFETELNQAESVELHGFGDSSIQAYGSCVYVPADYGNKVDVHLMSSKTRAAPFKHLTIPRKELLSALLMVNYQCKIRS